MASITLLPEYPAPPGNKQQVIATVPGPSSYTQVSVASPPTGGQTIKASDLGLVDFDMVDASGSDDGQYDIVVIYPKNPAGPVTSVIFLWLTAATGAQVGGSTNLSSRTVRVRATGH